MGIGGVMNQEWGIQEGIICGGFDLEWALILELLVREYGLSQRNRYRGVSFLEI